MEAKDRWQLIEKLFHAALEMNPAERKEFLSRECAEDEQIRAEVDSLIRGFEKDRRFLEKGAFSMGLRALTQDAAEQLVGRTIGAYKIVRLIGKGGMGEVYLAEDTKLKRLVALKFLAHHLAADNWAKKHLIKEAQAAARLTHQNICPVYGFEEADGFSFIVMQFVEGNPLSSHINEKHLNAQQTLPLALQLVSAIAHAHSHGVLHRDLKPQNMILDTEGQLKVLDFGLAKVIQEKNAAGEMMSQMSKDDFMAGTVAYMSPEQLRAERLDFRSDIFSLGLVLYVMIGGENPFLMKSNAETISAVLTHKPKSLPYQLNGFSQGLERVIKKCLEKDKERRYQSASELMLELQKLQTNPPIIPRPRLTPVLIAALLVLVVAGIYFGRRYWPTTPPTLVILPFTSEDPNSSYMPLVAGLPENLKIHMAGLSKVKTIAPTVSNAEKKSPNDLVVEAGSGFDAFAVMFGRVYGANDAAMLQVRLVKVADNNQIWERNYDLKHTDGLELIKRLSIEVAEKLNLQLTEQEGRQLQAAQTDKSEAFKHYLRGRFLYKRRLGAEDINNAIKSFEQAIGQDQAMARAHAGLADCYLQLPSVAYGSMPMDEAVKHARAAANDALQIDDKLPEVYTSLGLISMRYDRNWADAEARFKQAISLDPNYPDARLWYSQLLLITRREGEALIESKRARDTDPLSSPLYLNQCRTWFMSRQYDSAALCLKDMLEKQPDNIGVQYVLGLVYQEKGRRAEALELFRMVYSSRPELGSTTLGYAYGKAGRRNDAVRILAEMEERAKREYVPPLEFAIVYVGLGDNDKAFEWLNRADRERFGNLIYLTVEPLFNSLRSDPRFAELARRLNLEP